MTPEERLEQLGITLPAVAAPVANYIPAKTVGPLIYISGQIPMVEGDLVCTGKVGAEVSLEQAREAARVTAVNILAALKSVAGDLSRVEAVRVEGFVASVDGFTDQAKVLNGASDLIVEILGDAGRHTRFAIGAAELPLGAPVEISAVFAFRD
ncbi:MAG: RidA family protein [Planctomycetota bacterium]|jgi:enamine deaminase RidA (YjgF/YER057c/UK114 family)